MFGFGTPSVSVTEAHEALGGDGHCLLDVRTKEEVRDAGFPGALNIPLDRLESQAQRLSAYQTIHVVCRSGGRSGMATNLLHGLGFTHAKTVTGGLLAWQAAGLPTE